MGGVRYSQFVPRWSTLLLLFGVLFDSRFSFNLASPESDSFNRGLPTDTLSLPQDVREGGRPARVGIVASEFSGIVPNGGVGTFYTALAQDLAAAGHEVILLYTQGFRSHSAVGDFEYWRKWYDNSNITLVPVHHAPHYGSSYHASMSYEAYLKLKALNAEEAFDVVHFPDWQGHGYYALLAKHLGRNFLNTTLCVMVHGPLRWARLGNGETLYDPSDIEVDFMEKQTIKFADILLSPSEYLIKWIMSQGWQVPEDSIYIQPYLTPDVKPVEGECTGEKDLIDEIVFFGRWEARKGIRTFCDAINGLVVDLSAREEPGRQFKVTFMGSDRGKINGVSSRVYVGNCIDQWKRSSVEGKTFPISDVTLKSSLNSYQAHKYLQEARCIAVLPSLFENSPLSIFELISMKIPFVASNAGGIPELVHPTSRAKTIFEAGSADQLKEKLLGSLNLPGESLHVRGMYDPQSVHKQWVRWHELEAVKHEVQVTAGLRKKNGVLDVRNLGIDDESLQPELPLNKAMLSNKTTGDLSLCLMLQGNEEAVRATLDSLAAQEMRDYEILLWDTRSDSPGEKFLLENGYTRVVRLNPKLSVGINFIAFVQNSCAKEASGTHLLFVQAGQVLMRNAVRDLWIVALGNKLDITTSFMSLYSIPRPGADLLQRVELDSGDSFHVDVEGLRIFPFVYLGKAVLPGLYQNVFGGPLMIVRREALEDIGGFDLKLPGGYSVWEFYCRASYSGLSMEVLPIGLYLNPMRQGYTRTKKDLQVVRQVLDHFLRDLPEKVRQGVLSMSPDSIASIADLA